MVEMMARQERKTIRTEESLCVGLNFEEFLQLIQVDVARLSEVDVMKRTSWPGTTSSAGTS